MLPVYVINLDRRPDRWKVMSEQLDRLGIEATRIPAVDARLLAAQEEWESETNGNPPFWRINLGAAAGMLGHSKAMIDLIGSTAPAALILEDDAELAPDTPTLLESVDWWPAGAHIVRLYGGYPNQRRTLWLPSGETPSGRSLCRLERWNNGAVAYLVNRAGARIALKAFADPDHTVDHTLFDLQYSKTARRLHTVQTVPAAAKHLDYDESDQQRWRERLETEYQGGKRRRYRLRRNIEAIPYKMRVLALRAMGKVRKRLVPYSEAP